MKRRLVLLLMAALAACAVLPDRRASLTPLIGATEAELVQRMGVPSRTIETGGIKFLAYTERHVDVVPGMAPFPAWGPYSYGYYGGYGGFPPEVIERNCETTFEFVGGRVRSFTLRGRLLMNASNHPASRFSPASGRRVVALLLSLGMLALASCTPPRVGFSPEPPPGYAKSLEGSGHVNPEDPGLPNGGE